MHFYLHWRWKHYPHGQTACETTPNLLYNKTNSWDNTISDHVTVSFTSVQIKFYGVLDPEHSIGAISIDGNRETMIDFYATTHAGDQLLWTSPVLSADTHTFKLRVTGDKNPSSANAWVAIDRVDILS